MGFPSKIMTCCFCGSKAALKLERGRHELSCARCGAPLRDLKMIPKEREKAPAISHATPVRTRPSAAYPEVGRKAKKAVQPPKRRKRLTWFKDMAEEVFDFVEDIFD